MKCPGCGQVPIVVEFEQVEIDYCPACRGLWLDAGELAVLLGRPDPLRPEDLAGARPGPRRCPRCDRALVVQPSPGAAVEVDLCPALHGLWLDPGELEAIARAQAAPERLAALSAFCRELFRAPAP